MLNIVQRNGSRLLGPLCKLSQHRLECSEPVGIVLATQVHRLQVRQSILMDSTRLQQGIDGRNGLQTAPFILSRQCST